MSQIGAKPLCVAVRANVRCLDFVSRKHTGGNSPIAVIHFSFIKPRNTSSCGGIVLQEFQHDVLEMIARGRSSDEVADCICRWAEARAPVSCARFLRLIEPSTCTRSPVPASPRTAQQL